jgi:hypothetical protein
MSPARYRWFLVALLGAIGFSGPPLEAQIPEKYTNLKVIPADIKRPELVRMMRTMAGSLGVRCNYCHVGGDPNTLQGVQFASDSLETKRTARRMLEMVQSINRDYISKVNPDSTSRIVVSCATCHRRLNKPELINDLVKRLLTRYGPDSAAAEYRRLRGIYYGSGSYDFSEVPLNFLAETMATGGNLDQALSVLRLNLEFFPNSARVLGPLGQVTVAKGDTAQGLKLMERALELTPDDRFLQQAVERLRRKPTGNQQ